MTLEMVGGVMEPEGSWLLCLVWEEGRWSTGDLRLVIGLSIVIGEQILIQ